jgi:hypothetical protein
MFKTIAKFGVIGVSIYVGLNIVLAICLPLFLGDFIVNALGVSIG